MIISFPYKATPKVEREKITAILYKREMENVIGFPTYTERRVIPFESQQNRENAIRTQSNNNDDSTTAHTVQGMVW